MVFDEFYLLKLEDLFFFFDNLLVEKLVDNYYGKMFVIFFLIVVF